MMLELTDHLLKKKKKLPGPQMCEAKVYIKLTAFFKQTWQI